MDSACAATFVVMETANTQHATAIRMSVEFGGDQFEPELPQTTEKQTARQWMPGPPVRRSTPYTQIDFLRGFSRIVSARAEPTPATCVRGAFCSFVQI